MQQDKRVQCAGEVVKSVQFAGRQTLKCAVFVQALKRTSDARFRRLEMNGERGVESEKIFLEEAM